MSYRKPNILTSIDWFTVLLYVTLVVLGWLSIYSASFDFENTSFMNMSERAAKQMTWIGTSLALAFVIMMLDRNWSETFAYWIYFLIILLLLATLAVATDIKGSRSWLILGPVHLQPAEFSKFATALALAKLLGSYKFELKVPQNFLKAVGLILLPMLIIILQKEAGSALVFLGFFLVLYREGMTGRILFFGVCAIIYFVINVRYADLVWHGTPMGEFIVFVLIALFSLGMLAQYKKGRYFFRVISIISLSALIVGIALSFFLEFNLNWVVLSLLGVTVALLFLMYFKHRASSYLIIALFTLGSILYTFSVDYVFDKILQPHQQTRIQVTLGIIDDPSGAGYNVKQSQIAIGSGGLDGKGFLNGTQTRLKYVPEQDTDFIFCTIGEEKGFLGTITVLLLLLTLILRVIYLAERQKTTFNRVYAYCVAAIFFVHVAINIGMVIGITPVIGIPLPFFSYGGSSLWSFTIILFVLLRLDASRNELL